MRIAWKFCTYKWFGLSHFFPNFVLAHSLFFLYRTSMSRSLFSSFCLCFSAQSRLTFTFLLIQLSSITSALFSSIYLFRYTGITFRQLTFLYFLIDDLVIDIFFPISCFCLHFLESISLIFLLCQSWLSRSSVLLLI